MAMEKEGGMNGAPYSWWCVVYLGTNPKVCMSCKPTPFTDIVVDFTQSIFSCTLYGVRSTLLVVVVSDCR